MTTIKKTKDHNQYVLTTDRLWVRDLTRLGNALDINNLVSESEYGFLASNESQNQRIRLAPIDAERFSTPKVLIVSDGYNFKEVAKVISTLPRSVTIMGVNGVINKWPADTRMDYYIANNPYPECMSFLPCIAKVPKVILSNRTYPAFVRTMVARKMVVYKYTPTPSLRFGKRQSAYTVDDYRNPICAATYLANKFGVSQLAFLGCDESFEGDRPGSVLLENGLYTYPQHLVSANLLDGSLFWMKSTKIGNASFGPKLKFAEYIPLNNLGEWFRT